MDKTLRRVVDFDEQQAETYRYWQSRSAGERFVAILEHSAAMYRLKGVTRDGEGLRRSFVRVERQQR